MASKTPKYKTCFVPDCGSTTVRTPEKAFVSVPQKVEIRRTWFDAARRNAKDFSPSSQFYCCEDHFETEDFSNKVKHDLTGCPLRVKENVVPTLFDCQLDRERSHTTTGRATTVAFEQKALVESLLQACHKQEEERKSLTAVTDSRAATTPAMVVSVAGSMNTSTSTNVTTTNASTATKHIAPTKTTCTYTTPTRMEVEFSDHVAEPLQENFKAIVDAGPSTSTLTHQYPSMEVVCEFSALPQDRKAEDKSRATFKDIGIQPPDPASAANRKALAAALATAGRPAGPRAGSVLMQPPGPRDASQQPCLLRRIPLLLQCNPAHPPCRTLAQIRKGTLETVRVLMPASEAKVTPVAKAAPAAPRQKFKPAVLRRPMKSIVVPAQRIVPLGNPVALAAQLNGTVCNSSPASKTRRDDDGAQTGAGTVSRKRTASADILVAAGEREEVVAKKQHKPVKGQSDCNASGGRGMKWDSLEERDSGQVSEAGSDAMAGAGAGPGTDSQTETVQAIMGLDAPLFSGNRVDTADDSKTEMIVVKQEPGAVEEGLVPGEDSTVAESPLQDYVKISFIPVEKLENFQVANLQGCDEGDPLRLTDADTVTEETVSLLPGDLRSSASLGVGFIKRILGEATMEATEGEDSEVRTAMIGDSDTGHLKHSKAIKSPRQEAVGKTPSHASAAQRRCNTGSDAVQSADAASEKAEHTETASRRKRRATHPATCKQCDCTTHCPSAARRNAQLRNARRRKASQARVIGAETGKKRAAKPKRSPSKAESEAPLRQEEAVPPLPPERRSVHEAAATLESEQELLKAAREATATEADRLATARAALRSDTQALMKLHTQLPREWTALTRLRRVLQEHEAALESSRRAFDEQRQQLGLATGAAPHQKRLRVANPSLQPTVASYWSLCNPGSVVVGEDAEAPSSSYADTETSPIIIVIPPASKR